jgi:hypothetical protein
LPSVSGEAGDQFRPSPAPILVELYFGIGAAPFAIYSSRLKKARFHFFN